jgi:hypothetical protein
MCPRRTHPARRPIAELSARVAFSLVPKGGKPVLGVVSAKAKTQTDMDARLVVVKAIEVADVRFPSLDAPAKELKVVVENSGYRKLSQ